MHILAIRTILVSIDPFTMHHKDKDDNILQEKLQGTDLGLLVSLTLDGLHAWGEAEAYHESEQ